jgi:hypothetical protein
MAFIHIDGFDYYTGITTGAAPLSQRYTTGTNESLVAGRFGGLALRQGQGVLRKSLPAASATLTVGAAINPMALPSSAQGQFIFRTAGTQVLQIGIGSDGRVLAGRGDFTTQLIAQSAAGVIVAGVFSYLEIVLTRNASAGAVEVFCNGASVLAASAANTGATDPDQLDFGNGFGAQPTVDLDDFYIANTAARVGERRVETLSPNGDSQKNWTPLTGTDNYAMVTSFDGDTSYVSAAAAGTLDLYDFANLSSLPANVSAVQTIMSARKDDATTRTVRARVRSGGANANGATVGMVTAYGLTADIFAVDPNTSAAWLAAAVNAIKAGPEVVS